MPYLISVKLVDWRGQGISYKTAWRWVKDDVMPVPWRQLATGTILVDVDESSTAASVALYARVSSHDQRADFRSSIGARLSTYAAGPPRRAANPYEQKALSKPTAVRSDDGSVATIATFELLARKGVNPTLVPPGPSEGRLSRQSARRAFISSS
jgi:hypothetical protein